MTVYEILRTGSVGAFFFCQMLPHPFQVTIIILECTVQTCSNLVFCEIRCIVLCIDTLRVADAKLRRFVLAEILAELILTIRVLNQDGSNLL